MSDTVVNRLDLLDFHTSLISDGQLLAHLPTKGSKENTETKFSHEETQKRLISH